MKRTDVIVLCAIAIIALYFGTKLAGALSWNDNRIKIIENVSLDDFTRRAEEAEKEGQHRYLIARQWEWSGDIELEAGRDYVLHIASEDVQHGFHLERGALGKSVDVLIKPGREYLIELKNLASGIFAVGCTQYCGVEHNKMRTRLIVR